MFLPAFLSSLIRCSVFSNESVIRSIVALMPPEADFANYQSAQRITKVLGSSLEVFSFLLGFHVRIDWRTELISSSVTVGVFLRANVAR